MAANRSAVIRSANKASAFKLRVQLHPRGVFWDVLVEGERHRPVITTTEKSARRLAQWILDNTEEFDEG